ncbi:serine hydrolase domain-containing protein [Caulobacter sp. 1776]|uniref:serine hydrolase domain-containing protein n=1 Tax=Caulobacter sp. 1776 TaxID=3156420 RepID=UPI00339B63EA
MSVSHKAAALLALAIGAATTAMAVAAPTPKTAVAAFERGPTAEQAKADDALAVGTLSERLRRAKTPGVSIAVVDGCKLAWTRAYGVRSATDATPVRPETRFQAASISKTLTAVAALRLAKEGKLALDRPVNAQLRTWTLPAAPGIDVDKVTPRALLSHTGGTTISSFPGYARGTPVPTLDQVLAGAPPVNTGPIIAEKPAGAQVAYSGGGMTVMQKLIEDVSGASFAQVLDREVIRRAGMTRSTFSTTAPSDDIALGHDEQGAPIAGDWHAYPELAAAGLWTTPTDLAHFGIAMSRAYQGEGDFLPQNLAREALMPQSALKDSFGLGFRYMPADDGNTIFFHTGSNAGYRAFLVFDAPRCRGVAMMTNSDGGMALGMSLLRDIGRIYDWPFITKLLG